MSQANAPVQSTSSTAVSVKLAADGRNWKDWIKQITNFASSEGAFRVLDGGACPPFDTLDTKYSTTPLIRPSYASDALPSVIAAEMRRVGEYNTALRDLNDVARRLRKDDEAAYNLWVARDARLQNTILSSIEKSLITQVRTCTSASAMYVTLKDLNNDGDFASAAKAWKAFIDLRAEDCPTVRNYIGKFREALNDLTTQGITIGWAKPSATGATADGGVAVLTIIHFLHGLDRVLPQWVEARNNDLRQNHTWTIDTLIASLEDHIRHTKEDPVKSFITISKQAEETRVLFRLNGRGNHNTPKTATTAALPAPTARNKGKRPVGYCNYCKKEHGGPNKDCWAAHPELMPEWAKKKRDDAARAAGATRTNVTIAGSEADDNLYGPHVFATIASLVSPTLLAKAVGNSKYRHR